MVALALLALGPAAPLAAQQPASGAAEAAPLDPEAMPRPSLQAVRIDEAVTLDGRLDEAIWSTAPTASDFIQAFPNTGAPASQRTDVRVLYDDAQLYIGAMIWETEPDGVIRKGLRRDFASTEDDIFGVALDTYLDKRNAFYFFINPNGAIRDSQAFDNSRISGTEWDGIIHVRTAVVEGGWSVEVAVPFSTLRFDPAREQTWGINFLRRVRRDNEDSHWAPLARRSQIHRMALAGTLTGLGGIAPGRNLTVKPYLKVEDASGAAASADQPVDGGVDVKYGITPRMTLDATWRTDFSQVEVDQQQVNLTRFPLFFPEKRGFFIENTGTFAFGDVSERNVRLGASPRDFTLFHSRRIGLEGGQPIGIDGGARLTGRAGGMEVGLMTMQTESAGTLPAENFAVARVRGSLFGALDLGGMALNRQATGDGSDAFNRSWGVDANARLGSLILHSYLAGSDENGPQVGDRYAGRVSAAWRDAFWDASALVRHVGDGFDPGVGYVRRTGIRHGYVTVGAHPQIGRRGVSELNPYAEIEYVTNLDGRLETRGLTGGFDVDFLDAGLLSLAWTDRFDRIERPFGALGATVPAGSYDFEEWSASYSSNASRTLAGRVSLSGGGYYQGTRRAPGIAGTWKPSSHFTLELSGAWNRLDLDGGRYRSEVLGARVSYDVSTTLFGSALVQYDDQSGQVVSNVRLNWVHAPLSDLFLVYTERRASGGGGAVDRRITLKATRLFAL